MLDDETGMLRTDRAVLIVKVRANDPRTYPTQVVTLVRPAGTVTLAELDAVRASMTDEYQWGMGYRFDIQRRGGGIGSSGAEVFELVLGVVGAVPPMLDLYRRFTKHTPECPDHDQALHEATWAIARAYPTVERGYLTCVADLHHTDHRSFQFTLTTTADRFEVDVYGTPDTVMATRVSWLNGNAWGDPAPGQPA